MSDPDELRGVARRLRGRDVTLAATASYIDRWADQWDKDRAEIERLKKGLRAMMRFAPQYVPAGATEENFEALRIFRTAERLLESTNGG